ncbi:hypothetical protein ACYPKM_03280 [Pseudomonas aeruginosa]
MEVALFKSALETLNTRLKALCAAIPDDAPAFCTEQPGAFAIGEEAVAKAKTIYANLFLNEDQQDGRETATCYGAICVSEDVLELARQVNQAKDDLKKALDVLASSLRPIRGESLTAKVRSRLLRKLLGELGLVRLSRRLCNRHIPIIEFKPKKIGFSYKAAPRSLKKITPAEAQNLLQAKGYESESAAIDLEQLGRVSPDQELWLVQELPGLYKVNISDAYTGRYQPPVDVYMPLLYCGDPVPAPLELPAPQPPRLKQGSNRVDQKVSETPLFRSLPIHTLKSQEDSIRSALSTGQIG